MPENPITLLPFDFANAPEHDYAALNRHMNRVRAETQPDDPPTPLEETVAMVQNVPAFVQVHAWNGWNAGRDEIVATGIVVLFRTDENTHLAQFDLAVEPAYRRRGVGRTLLRNIASVARDQGRRLMVTDTNERVPAGEALMRRLGATRGLENHTNQLMLADLDTALVAQWQADAVERAAGFTLVFSEGAYPDDQLEAIAVLSNVMNTAPRDDLDMEDMRMKPEQIRQMEKMMLASGKNRWTLIATETSTGRFVGFTEVHLSPSRPQIVSQGGTGVFPEFRGKGLGRWLKAAMLDRIRRDLPDARFVRTGNADSNSPMLAINTALGFKPYISRCVWQVETDKVFEYLDNNSRTSSADHSSSM